MVSNWCTRKVNLMENGLIIALLVGCSASIVMNVGKGIQKLKVQVLKKGKKVLSPENRRDFLIWCVGMTMTAGAGLLFTKALDMTDKPSVVSSLNGIGLIALSIFSLFVLKEKVGLREWGAVLMIIIGTAIFQLFNTAGGEQHYTLRTLLLSFVACIVVYAALVVITTKIKKGQAFVFAAIAGTFLAYMVIMFDIASVSAGGKGFINILMTPYFITGFFMGNGAFVFTNLAFFHGSGIVIVPTVNSFLIVVPMILEVFIFGVILAPIQVLGVVFIVAGVILLTTGKGHTIEADQLPQAA